MKALFRTTSFALILLATIVAVGLSYHTSLTVAVSGFAISETLWNASPSLELSREPEPLVASASASFSSVFLTSHWQDEARTVKPDRSLQPMPVVPRQPFDRADLYYRLPATLPPNKVLRALVVLHGMGNRGDVFSRNMIAEADSHGWLLIAPTIRYGDWTNPEQLLKDDLLYTRMLRDTLDTLPAELGIRLRQHVLLLGFSRGAQLAQRFAFFYPERVETVAAISGGAYTLPQENSKDPTGTRLLILPYGVGDVQKHLGKPLNWDAFKKITFWVGVGANDNRKDDVPRTFDPYVGNNRVERAQNLYNSLCAVGVDAHIAVFPNTDHEMTAEMRRAMVNFLRTDELADNLND
ncbi:MAG: hypothetical protein HY868_22375 [Chloroflexi bacterium]|nr:hypothetical protein [Chloroflexota bacterium]